MKGQSFRLVSCIGLVLLGSTAVAQPVSNALNITDSYGMGAAQAVVSETGPDRVYCGFGTSFAILDPTTMPPTLVPGLLDNPVHLRGMVRDLELVRGNNLDRVYIAAGPRGVVSYNLSQGTEEHESDLPYSAFAVAAIDVEHDSATRRIVFVGTNHDDLSGEVHVFEHVSQVGFLSLGTYTAASEVFCLDVSDEVVPGVVTLLVGTACAGVFRFDVTPAELHSMSVDLSNDLVASWNGPSGGGIFARDIEIHVHPASQIPYAFVAAHDAGVFRLQLNPSTIVVPAGQWPIQTARANAKAVTVQGNHLVVGRGGRYQVESQFYEACSSPVPCSAGEGLSVARSDVGVFIYDLGSTPTAFGDTWNPVSSDTGRSLMALDVRPGTSTAYSIDASADTGGYRLYDFNSTSVTETESFTQEEGLLVNSVDEVVLADVGGQQFLYAALENGIGVFDVSSGSLGDPVTMVGPGTRSVVLAEPTGTTPPLLVGSATEDMEILDLSSPATPSSTGTVVLQDRANYFVQTVNPASQVVPPLPVNTDRSWLYSAWGSQDPQGFEAFDLRDVAATGQASSAQLMLTYEDVSQPPQLADTMKHFGGILVREISGVHAVYVAYGPRPAQSAFGALVPGETTAGLLVLKVHWTNPSPPQVPELVADPQQHAVAWSGFPTGSSASPAWVSVSEATGRIYAAHACLGVVQWTLNGDFAVSLTGTRSSTFTVDGHTLTRAAMYAVESNGWVYTCYLGGTPSIIAREPANGFGTGSVEYFHTPMQALQLEPDPTTANAFYVADARGGVHHVQFQP